MSYRSMTASLIPVAGLLVSLSTAQGQPAGKPMVDQPNILREGSGARRDALTTRELAPFDATAWSKVTRWSGDTAPSASDLSGQVVLICTWKYYHPVSKRAMETARRLAESYAAKGLVVAAVHDSQNFEEAVKAAPPLAAKDAKFFVGYDEKGEFRKAIDSDGDPDFYVLDRAGQLRFADISTESVEPAVTLLLAETAEKAAARKSDIESELERARRQAAKSDGARQAVDMTSIPPVPPGFTAPAPEAFQAISWPPTKFQKMSSEPSSGGTEAPAPPVVQLPDGEGWIGGKPELQGRVWVLYFWAFDSYESYSIMQRMDQLQKAKGRDIAVVGILTGFPNPNTSYGEQKPEDPAKLLRKVTDFTRGKALQHSTYVEPTGQLLASTRGGETSGSERPPIPYAVVCSSDGTVRFSGWAKHPSFESTLDNTLALDPGVRARRAADSAYLKAKNK